MTPTAATRDELVEDVDQALAAVRRVILRAIDAPAKPPTILQAIRATAPKPAAPRGIPPKLERISAAGIEIDLDERTVTFRGFVAQVSLRQAQLAAVLAKASPSFITRSDATARAWPDLAVSSRETTATTAVKALAEALAPIKIKCEAVTGYGLRLWSMEEK